VQHVSRSREAALRSPQSKLRNGYSSTESDSASSGRNLGSAISCLFQLVSQRYEKGSIILTSNKSSGDWGTIFADNVIASAILDRVMHHSTTINIKGESHRLKAQGQEEEKKAGVIAAKNAAKEAAWLSAGSADRPLGHVWLRDTPSAAHARPAPNVSQLLTGQFSSDHIWGLSGDFQLTLTASRQFYANGHGR
jgi:hypothetical protein